MTKHSNYYIEKKSDLAKKEARLRKALDDQGIETQKQALKLAKVAGIGLMALVGSYAIYRLLGLRSEEDEETIAPSKKSKSKILLDHPAFNKLMQTGLDLILNKFLKN